MATIAVTTRAEAPAHAIAEYAAVLATLRELPPSAWSAPTDCAGWTVREVVAHLNGASEEWARLPVFVRHYARALVRRRDGALIDSVNAQQIADRRGRSNEQLVAELERLAPRAVRGRQHTPSLVRRLPLPKSAGGQPGDTMGYLNDVVYTRDLWMHRVDIARATGTELLASTAEPAIVGQVVRDLSRNWTGPACTLTLTGRVTGTWRLGPDPDGPTPEEGVDAVGVAPVGTDQATTDQATPAAVTVDAVALCRLLSGRGDETGLAGQGGAAAAALRRHRILF